MYKLDQSYKKPNSYMITHFLQLDLFLVFMKSSCLYISEKLVICVFFTKIFLSTTKIINFKSILNTWQVKFRKSIFFAKSYIIPFINISQDIICFIKS